MSGAEFVVTRSGTVHATYCPRLSRAAEVQPWVGTMRSHRDRRCMTCFPAVTIPPRPRSAP